MLRGCIRGAAPARAPGWLARPRARRAHAAEGGGDELLVVVVVGCSQRGGQKARARRQSSGREMLARSPSHGEDVRSFCDGSAARGRVFPFFRRRQTAFLSRAAWLLFLAPKSRQFLYLANEARPLAGRESRRSERRHSARVPRAFTVGAARRSNGPTIARSCTPWRAACLSPRCNHRCFLHTENTRSHARPASIALGGLTRP